MNIATLNFSTTDWDDNIRLVTRGECPAIISLKNHESVLELNRVLMIAYCEDHEGSLDINIDGSDYNFPQSTWHALLSVADQWLEKFLPSEHPEFFEFVIEAPRSAEIIPLFG